MRSLRTRAKDGCSGAWGMATGVATADEARAVRPQRGRRMLRQALRAVGAVLSQQLFFFGRGDDRRFLLDERRAALSRVED